MKKYVILLLFSYITSYSQDRNDTIFIQYNQNLDLIKKSEIQEVWILNDLFAEEMNTYKNQKKNIKEKKMPPPIFLNKPSKFYKYKILDIETRRSECSFINFYPRKDLKHLTQFGKVINIVDKSTIYNVTFFVNTTE